MACTIADLQAEYFQRIIEKWWPQFGAAGTATTFTLYRRTRAGASNDLGVPNAPWTETHTDVDCTVVGIKLSSEGGFKIPPPGQIQQPFYEVHTAELDVVPGDNVVLALDGKVYHVERATREASVMYLLLDPSKAQLQV